MDYVKDFLVFYYKIPKTELLGTSVPYKSLSYQDITSQPKPSFIVCLPSPSRFVAFSSFSFHDFPFVLVIRTMILMTITIIMGDRIHHHDQLMLPSSFDIIKTRQRAMNNALPLSDGSMSAITFLSRG